MTTKFTLKEVDTQLATIRKEYKKAVRKLTIWYNRRKEIIEAEAQTDIDKMASVPYTKWTKEQWSKFLVHDTNKSMYEFRYKNDSGLYFYSGSIQGNPQITPRVSGAAFGRDITKEKQKENLKFLKATIKHLVPFKLASKQFPKIGAMKVLTVTFDYEGSDEFLSYVILIKDELGKECSLMNNSSHYYEATPVIKGWVTIDNIIKHLQNDRKF